MKFKVGDKVRVIKSDHTWISWMPEMDRLVGQVHIIVGKCVLSNRTYPTLVVPGFNCGIRGERREEGEYGFPEHCLELAVKPGEQLEFSFMKD